MELQNANPVIFDVSSSSLSSSSVRPQDLVYENEEDVEYVTRDEVFEHIRHLNDPEHPLSLEQLNVVSRENIVCLDPGNVVHIRFTPTIPHCSMATLIGLW